VDRCVNFLDSLPLSSSEEKSNFLCGVLPSKDFWETSRISLQTGSGETLAFALRELGTFDLIHPIVPFSNLEQSSSEGHNYDFEGLGLIARLSIFSWKLLTSLPETLLYSLPTTNLWVLEEVVKARFLLMASHLYFSKASGSLFFDCRNETALALVESFIKSSSSLISDLVQSLRLDEETAKLLFDSILSSFLQKVKEEEMEMLPEEENPDQPEPSPSTSLIEDFSPAVLLNLPTSSSSFFFGLTGNFVFCFCFSKASILHDLVLNAFTESMEAKGDEFCRTITSFQLRWLLSELTCHLSPLPSKKEEWLEKLLMDHPSSPFSCSLKKVRERKTQSEFFIFFSFLFFFLKKTKAISIFRPPFLALLETKYQSNPQLSWNSGKTVFQAF